MGLLRGLGRAVGGLLAGVFGLLKGVLTGLGSLLAPPGLTPAAECRPVKAGRLRLNPLVWVAST